jgi:TRAP transporter TAXI family solute receptor
MVPKRRMIPIRTAILALILALSLGYFVYNQPTKLTIAVGPIESYDARLIEAIAQRLQNRKESVQLKVVYTEGSAASSDALDSGKVDLAVIRGDLPKQPSAGLVVTLHRDPVMILTSAETNIKAIADLRGKRVGVIRARPNDSNTLSINTLLLKTIFTYYGISERSVTLVPITINEASKAIEDKRIDAIFSVTTITDPNLIRIVEGMSFGHQSTPVFIPIPEPEAIILKNPLLLKDEIVRGAFGGQPPTPSEAVPTIAVTHSIAANTTLSDVVIAELTRNIFKLRPILAREIKLASGIEVPSSDKNAAMPLHTGAAAYIDNEEQTFFDKYGDFVYIAAMLFGLLGSGVAALISRWSSDARSSALKYIEESVSLVGYARQLQTFEDVERIEQRADKLVENVVRNAVQAHLNQTDLASFNIAINHMRQVINDKKLHLASNKVPFIS